MTFDQLRDGYAEATRGLLEGGADLLLVETVFDTLNGKAAIAAVKDVLEEQGADVPLVVSVTIVDAQWAGRCPGRRSTRSGSPSSTPSRSRSR